MAFPDDLLELAQVLRSLHPEGAQHQASLRRAVSTAYYALFHLLISETTANWARPELRAILGRCFDHGPMKTASETKISQINTAFKNKPPEGAEAPTSPKPAGAGSPVNMSAACGTKLPLYGRDSRFRSQ